MRKVYYLFLAIAIIALALVFWLYGKSILPGEIGPVACTMEAKICPDGSAVGRTGPDCEFATCPASNATQYKDLIRVTSPKPGDVVTSPLVIKGEARGTWFFEASFPVNLTNWDGLIISEHFAQAKSDWMTEDYVPFEATIEFK